MQETRICANCGAEHPIEDMFEVEGDWLCEDCADRLTVICDHCDERIYAENAIEDEHYSLCHDCDCIIRTYSAYYDGRRSHLLRKLLGRSRGRDSRV
ncbi:Uncharacterised protein [uncultured Butyricicoccus sp.]|jgi:formylmethanofuran dehydrogenase subunit E|nr:Uncharacterised protein [uncultured Butyricicoccus sp.]